MPTFTTIALETLLEPRVRGSSKNSLYLKQDTSIDSNKDKSDAKKKKPHIFISPALYTTPEPTPIPDSSADSVSPSPYVVNRKRRDLRLPREVINRIDGFDIRQQKSSAEDDESRSDGDSDDVRTNQSGKVCSYVSAAAPLHQGKGDNFLGVAIVGDRTDSFVLEGGVDSPDDFFDPRDSMSLTSSSEVDDFEKPADKQTAMSNQGTEFYDADEDFFPDGSISNVASSHGSNIESELRAARLNLLEEIERRRSVEDALSEMCSRWQRIGSLLSQAGLTFPTPLHASSSMQLEIDSIERFSQELIVARFVSEAIGKGEARAEAEIAAETIITSKDQEISRLRDRLQYYEAVNHEMSHRNQEVMGKARRQRQRKKSQRRWIWGCLGLSIAIGTSMIAHSYLPQTSKHLLVISSDDRTASFINSSESA